MTELKKQQQLQQSQSQSPQSSSHKQAQEEENLVLPQFGCKCGLEYSTLSSLSNHIKMTHQNNADEWKIKRGVPEGRRQRLNPAIKEKIRSFIKSNERLNNLCDRLSSSQCRGLFMQNVKYIENLMERHNLNKQQEIVLQKEHIKFQEVWNDIDISEICNQTQQYLNAFCSVFFDAQSQYQMKIEQEDNVNINNCEEQKEEKSKIDQKSYYFYKTLLESNKSFENKQELMKQKIGGSSIAQASDSTSASITNNSTLRNTSSTNLNQKLYSDPSSAFSASALLQMKDTSENSSAASSPSAQSYLVNIHSSLSLEQDQYMRNFFNNYLLNRSNKN